MKRLTAKSGDDTNSEVLRRAGQEMIKATRSGAPKKLARKMKKKVLQVK